MGRELQKKKKRSSTPKIKLKPKKRANPRANPIIAANWDDKQTLSQNYRRLGLTSRLNGRSGGIEKKVVGSKSSTERQLAIANAASKVLTPSEARIERDPVTGKVVKVVHSDRKLNRYNPLNDPLLTDDEDDDDEFEGFEDAQEELESHEQNEVVRQLEEEAAKMPEKRERKQSQREQEWIERLVSKHGENYAAMMRDRRLNPMQQTEADIARRVKKWKASQQVESVDVWDHV